jgi:hypothetical protein
MAKNFKKEVTSALGQLAHVNIIDNKAFETISKIVATEFDDWANEKVTNLRAMVADWELVMGDSDGSMYSLGLRRAIDEILGEEAISKLPILETPETPNERK